QRLSNRRRPCLRGWGCVLGTKRAQGSPQARVRRRAIWAIAHRLCRMLWKILHEGVHYDERGPAVSAKSQRTRTARMIKELQKARLSCKHGDVIVCATTACLRARLRTAPIRSRERQRADAQLLMTFC